MKISKGVFSLICAFICVSILISIGAVIYKESYPASLVTESPLRGSAESKTENEGTNRHYPRILKEYRGNIGIFSESGELLEIIDVAVVTLPVSERKRLENGIKARSDKEMRSLIEDFSG